MESPESSTARHTTYSYNPKALLDVPHRLFKPPKPEAPRVGRVRQLSLTPLYEVKLEDVLAGQHLPPLALPEFESYLMYTERSSENLCFILWFRDYEKQYQAWSRSPIYPQQSPALAHSYSQAKKAFLTPSAPLELNLPAATVTALLATNPPAHPPPSAFADMRHQVEAMLKESLNKYVRSCGANAGRNRGLFALAVGLFLMCVGLAPILVSVLENKSKWLRLAALPCFWLGATAFICGLHGVCIVIFLFGDARQLTAYELARPKIQKKLSLPSPHRISSIGSVNCIELSLPKPAKMPDSSSSQHLPSPNPLGPRPTPRIDVSPSHAANEKYLPSAWSEPSSAPSPNSPVAMIAPFLFTPPRSTAGFTFHFEHLPGSAETGLTRSPPVWAPLTRALDCISIRSYWETVMRSATLAFLASLVLVGISVGVD